MVDSLSISLNGPIPPDPVFGKMAGDFRSMSARSNYSICEGPSKISGPIVSHYGYENENEKNFKNILDYSSNPKVRGDGLNNFKAHKAGNGINLLISSHQKPVYEATFRHRPKPKNYLASNSIKIRELMKKVREREAQKERTKEEKAKPVKATTKFEHVESKIKDLMLSNPKTPREPKHEFLRAHSRPGSGKINQRPHTAREAPKDSEFSMEASCKKSKDDIDFIKHNQQLAKQIPIRRAPSVEMLKNLQEKTNKQFEAYMERQKGKIPDYIEKRREELRKAHSDFLKNMPDPDQPPGHRKLPEEERENTLKLLQETHKKMIGELNSLPIRDDTFRIRQTKNEYEKRLAEVEEAIKIFSKPKVFVKVDQ